jgi:uncharacterized protein HemX
MKAAASWSERCRRGALTLLGSALILQALGLAAAAGPGGGDQQRAFQELKQLEREKLEEELQLIQASRRCVESANNLRNLHDCHRREREAEWVQRERFQRRIEAVRARYGIGPPRRGDGPPRRDGPPPPF